MLGKLIKHEFKATSRSFGVMYLLVFAITVVLKVLMEVEEAFNIDNMIMSFISVITIAAFILGIIAVALGTYVLIIKRFYDSMLKDEGYLSFTLPVKTWQHIAGKIITSYIWVLLSGLFICLAVFILLLGEGAVSSIREVFNEVVRMISAEGVWGYVVECILLMLVSLYTYISLGYACFSIGQTFGKNKVLGAFVTYIAIYFIFQIVSSILLVLVFGSDFAAVATTQEVPTSMFQKLMLISLITSIAEAVGCTVITNVMLSKKLNLE